ncbi:acyltransferase [Actinoplanes sp. NPDC049596]|uniref:acyltransferase family protein n=1 Tax=unclassified Actinoplanes TaxID=2626549 RepID=UPI00341E602F
MRRPELDLIRLVVVLGLVFFHAALVFDTRDDFYVKNPQTTEAVTWIAGLGVVWAMPALFLIAGLGSWHSIGRRGTRGFVVERLLRLGVPLVFAALTIVPIPQWIRYGASEPYPEFLRRYFDVHLGLSEFPFLVRGDLFETGHLWFVVLLLAFSLMLALVAGRLPLVGGPMRHRGVVFLPAVPVALIGALLGMEESFAGWSRWAYLLFFLYGFLLAADDRFRAAMRRDAKWAAAIGFLLFGAAGAFLGTDQGEPFTDMTAHAIIARVFFGLAGWFWLVAILGLLDRGRPPPGSRALGYLGLAALPLYILHQPILVVVAYFVVRRDLPMIVKYLAIVVITFAVMFAVYDVLVRRTRVTRFLFGMRP